MDNFLSTLIQNLNANTAAAVADGLNGNPALVEHILNHLDGAVMAAGLNANGPWLTALVGALDAPSLASALNTALGTAGGQAFVTDLLSTLDGGIVADALNANPGLTRELLNAGGSIGLGTTLHDLLVDAAAGNPGAFLTDLIQGLNGTMLANVLQNAATGATLTPGEKARLPFQSANGNGYTFLKVTWFYVFLKANTFLGPQAGWAWSNIEGAEPYHWDGSAEVPP
jgi:hypothetical protein